MALQIYNTYSREKEIFTPIQEGKVTFYLCGPTVYNYIHIGNARSTVAFDTIRRYLEYRGYQVDYVSNFTDVDDKIINAARQEGLSPQAIADKYIQAFKEDTGRINVKPATLHPRVMDHIDEIIDFNQVLIDKGHAYESQGDVYFRTASFPNYGHLSRKTLEELQQGASERTSLEDTERKENPVDFALWKGTKAVDEISWESPWGQGRPGWHIECSVMATEHLGETIDIHAGGQDLEFPHHENEIAQSESHSDQTFANYWMHNGFVTFGADEEKMSKSLGNFVLLRDLLDEVDPQVVRYLLATVHYRRPLRFDDRAITDARHQVERLKEVFRRIAHRIEFSQSSLGSDSQWVLALDELETAFVAAMDDDFNAANAMTEIFSLTKLINQYLEEEQVSSVILTAMKELLSQLLEVFGLILEDETVIDDEIEALIEARNEARANRDFQRADEIRDQLKAQGILLDDTPLGTTWKRVD